MIAYASGNFGKTLVFTGADLTMLFLLTDLLGLSAAAAGSLMMVALCGALVFDLLAARLVIRLRHQGKGYRWMVAVAAIPCSLAFALLYAMPALDVKNLWMLGAALLMFRGAYAVIDVPHNALMAQIAGDSRARGRVSGYRLLFSTASALIIATILAPMVQQASADKAFIRLALAGLAAGLLFALTMALCALTSSSGSGRPMALHEDGIDVPMRDPMVLAMGALALLTGFAAPAFGRMLLYIGDYVIGRPDLVRTLLLALAGGQFAGIAIWTALTHRFSKGRLLVMGHGVSALGLLLFTLCLPWPAMLIACTVLIGFGLASVFMLPWGLLADAVDVVAWRHGRRFETGLFAFYLVIVKASGAASMALTGWMLGWLGYLPGQTQSFSMQVGMLGLGLGVPFVGCLGAMLLAGRFDLDHDRHARLLAALARRWDRAGRKRPSQSDAEPVSRWHAGFSKSKDKAGMVAIPGQARHGVATPVAVLS